MKQILIWACIISLFLLLNSAKPDEKQSRTALLEFLSKISNSEHGINNPSTGWNSSSYPCKDNWKGINCDDQLSVKKITLDGFNFSGVFDARILCNVQSLSSSLSVINLTGNSIHGENLEEIKNCFQLTALLLGWNHFSGNLPDSISQLKNLNVLDLSHNQFSGPIPSYDFSNFLEFDVSYNNLNGSIPIGAHRFQMNSFIDNPGLCGPPLPNNCTSMALSSASEPPTKQENGNGSSNNGGLSNDQILMYAGYVLIALAILFIVLVWIYKKKSGKTKEENLDFDNNKKVGTFDDGMTKPSFSTVELKGKTDISTASAESGAVSSSLVVLTSPEVNGMRFEDLLKAPAELLGRGKHGSVYKVDFEDGGLTLVVKRIKDWMISSNEFRQRMRRLNQVKHPNVLPAIAYYSSGQEKLMVYEYQQNGSLFRLIRVHGNRSSQPFDFSGRLSVAAKIADALAFMHEELRYDRIPHGNLKSSNILLNNDMEPCISEYGLMFVDNHEYHQSNNILANNALQAAQEDYNSLFKADTYAFGVILLELLTGRMVLNEGLDLASWVLAVVSEEWTVEVFDKNLLCEGASEERMVNVLQIAIKCVNKASEARPSMKEVAMLIREIKEEDERSMDVSELSNVTRSFIDL